MKSESTEKLNYFIKKIVRKVRGIYCWLHNIFRYTPATYRALIEKGTNAAMMSMAQEKTPANDELTEEFL